MTVIAWDGHILAADRQINSGELKFGSSKIEKLETGEIIAWNGYIDAGLTLAKWYKNGANCENFPFDPKDKAMTELIVAGKAKVTYYCQSPVPNKVYGPMAWGSGALAALAVMKMGGDAIKAVEITCEVSNSCGMGVEYYTVISEDKVHIYNPPNIKINKYKPSIFRKMVGL